jgi:hypothetical protein
MSNAEDLLEIADLVKESADFLGTMVGQLPRQPMADELGGAAHWLREVAEDIVKPIDMVLHCPNCGTQHIDAMTETWPNEPHRSHLCHACGHIWRPADVTTNGVEAIKTRGKDDSPIVDPGRSWK